MTQTDFFLCVRLQLDVIPKDIKDHDQRTRTIFSIHIGFANSSNTSFLELTKEEKQPGDIPSSYSLHICLER